MTKKLLIASALALIGSVQVAHAATNTYGITTPATATIPVEKSLTVPAGLTGPASVAGKFTFTLTAKTTGAPMPAAGGDVVTNPGAKGGTANFGAIEFTAPGTYTYTVIGSRSGLPAPHQPFGAGC